MGILSLLVLLLLPIMHTFLKPKAILTQIRLEREAALFFRQTEVEVYEAFRYAVRYGPTPFHAHQLILYMDEGNLTYFKQGEKIIRTVSSQPYGGHLEMAHFVKDFRVLPVDDRLFQISLTLADNGLEYKVERMMGLKTAHHPEEVEET